MHLIPICRPASQGHPALCLQHQLHDEEPQWRGPVFQACSLAGTERSRRCSWRSAFIEDIQATLYFPLPWSLSWYTLDLAASLPLLPQTTRVWGAVRSQQLRKARSGPHCEKAKAAEHTLGFELPQGHCKEGNTKDHASSNGKISPIEFICHLLISRDIR